MIALNAFAGWLGLSVDEARPLFVLLPLFLIPLAAPFAVAAYWINDRTIRRHSARALPGGEKEGR